MVICSCVARGSGTPEFVFLLFPMSCAPVLGPKAILSPFPSSCPPGEQPDGAPKLEGSLEVGVKVGFLDVL